MEGMAFPSFGYQKGPREIRRENTPHFVQYKSFQPSKNLEEKHNNVPFPSLPCLPKLLSKHTLSHSQLGTCYRKESATRSRYYSL